MDWKLIALVAILTVSSGCVETISRLTGSDETVTVAPLRQGQRAVFEVTVEETPQGAPPQTVTYERIAHLLGESVVRDAWGREQHAVIANVSALEMPRPGEEQQRRGGACAFAGPRLVRVDFAPPHESVGGKTQSEQRPLMPLDKGTPSATAELSWRTSFRGDACPPYNPLAGRSIGPGDLIETRDLFGDRLGVDSAEGRSEPAVATRHEGKPAVELAVQAVAWRLGNGVEAHGSARILLVDGLPGPVALEFEGSGRDRVGEVDIVIRERLVDWSPGSLAIEQSVLLEPFDQQRVAFDPMHPDIEAFALDFPLAEALEVGRLRTDLMDWLERHPGAHLIHAGYRVETVDGERRILWRLDHDNGKASHVIQIRRNPEQPAERLPPEAATWLMDDVLSFEGNPWSGHRLIEAPDEIVSSAEAVGVLERYGLGANITEVSYYSGVGHTGAASPQVVVCACPKPIVEPYEVPVYVLGLNEGSMLRALQEKGGPRG